MDIERQKTLAREHADWLAGFVQKIVGVVAHDCTAYGYKHGVEDAEAGEQWALDDLEEEHRNSLQRLMDVIGKKVGIRCRDDQDPVAFIQYHFEAMVNASEQQTQRLHDARADLCVACGISSSADLERAVNTAKGACLAFYNLTEVLDTIDVHSPDGTLVGKLKTMRDMLAERDPRKDKLTTTGD